MFTFKHKDIIRNRLTIRTFFDLIHLNFSVNINQDFNDKILIEICNEFLSKCLQIKIQNDDITYKNV